MRVAIDVSSFAFGVQTGTSVYLRRLVPALVEADPELQLRLLFAQRRTEAAAAALAELRGPRVEIVDRSLWRGLERRVAAWAPWHPTARRLVGPVDVFHAVDVALPTRDATPVVASVLDLTTCLFPQYHTRLNRVHTARKLRWLRRAAHRVVAISEATKHDLCRLVGVDAGYVDVTPLARGTDPPPATTVSRRLRELRERHRLGPDRYILSVGTLEPRKNHARLVSAFDALAATRPDVRLVLAGARGWRANPADAAIAAAGARQRIHVLGGVSADDLAALYAGAAVLAYPSLYEGFGLPVLEAMAAGVPVVTSNLSSLPEVAGGAALLVDPTDPSAIRGALERVLDDPTLRDALRERGFARERQFTWRRTGEATLASYRRAIAGAAAEPAGWCCAASPRPVLRRRAEPGVTRRPVSAPATQPLTVADPTPRQ